MTVQYGLVPYDLAPPSAGPLVPPFRPLAGMLRMTPAERAAHERQAREEDEARQARGRELLTAARTEWEAARGRLAGNAPALAVLAIHRPYLSWQGTVACTACREDGYDEAEPVPWECPTYRAVTGEA